MLYTISLLRPKNFQKDLLIFKVVYGPAAGYDFIPFQLLSKEHNASGNTTNSSATTSNISVKLLSRLLDGSSDAIFHSGIVVGNSIQTKIFVCHFMIPLTLYLLSLSLSVHLSFSLSLSLSLPLPFLYL